MKIMAVDLGKVRTGIAVSDQNELLAFPVCVIEERDRGRLCQKISTIAISENVGEIVVGLPRNMDGSEGESAKNAREFSDMLQKATKLPVALRDERNTTISAHGYLNDVNVRAKKRKKVIDSVAATIILQDYLDFRRN